VVTEICLLYAATDHDIAAAVREAIEKVGFVVRDSRGASSESFRRLAREAVDASGALMVLWSEAMSDPDWVDADVKLIVAAWSRDRLLMARIDVAALPVGLRDQPCHELRSGQLDRDIGNLTLATLCIERNLLPGPRARQRASQLRFDRLAR
jgi:hypothetical protein